MDSKKQFSDKAALYGSSAVHARGETLHRAVRLAAPGKSDVVLDVATGAGHMALAIASLVREVVCLDLTPEMLAETSRNAVSRGFWNLRFVEGAAEQMPFDDAMFDKVLCRLAAHHFTDIGMAMAEMTRVLKPGGRLVIVDTTVPETGCLADMINLAEKLRDGSHVRNYRPSEWRAFFSHAGLHLLALDAGLTDGEMSFTDWVQRSATPPDRVAALRHFFTIADASFLKALRVRRAKNDLFFQLPRVIIAGRRLSQVTNPDTK